MIVSKRKEESALKVQRDVFRPSVPTPVGLVTCVRPGGVPNIITLGEVYMLSLKPLVMGISIQPHRYSAKIITETREYVINFPTLELVEATDICGTTSGASVDKFALTGLTAEPATAVSPPLIAECPLSVECRVTDVLPMGSHNVFVGEAVATHVEDWALDEDGLLDPVKARSIAFVGRSYWRVGERVGKAFVKRDL
jgi:flavin reductase (DIM6/NTAB) family NADH-FMN oxidoreductase RutF